MLMDEKQTCTIPIVVFFFLFFFFFFVFFFLHVSEHYVYPTTPFVRKNANYILPMHCISVQMIDWRQLLYCCAFINFV